VRKLNIIIPVVLIALLAMGFLFAPNNPSHVNLELRLSPPGVDFPLGTDNLGRCILSRLLYGGMTTVGIVLTGALLVALTGTLLGLLSCYGNKTNVLLEGLLNALTAIPPIAYLIVFIGAWGNGVFTILTAITLSLFLRLVKLVKNRAEIEGDKAYVVCARTSGAGNLRVLFFHILPNLTGDILYFLCLSSADMILAISGFSFIGLGLGDSVIDWGTMIAESMDLILTNSSLITLPVLFIVLTTLSFNILGRAIDKRRAFYDSH